MRASPPILGRLDPGTRRCVIRRSTDPSTERGLRSRTLDCVAGHLPKLSKQQQRVLSYIGKGYTTAQIAERLGVGHDTASVYVSKAITFVRERGRRRADEPMTLTRRERDVRTLLQDGLSNADIAARLGIGQRTAETHVGNVLRKSGVNRRDLTLSGWWRASRAQPPLDGALLLWTRGG
jgi:DNA-binding NarL/FixJ family response regulator